MTQPIISCPYFSHLQTVTHWQRKRREYLNQARACKAALTNPNGAWNLAPESERVKAAVGKWVSGARKAHAIAMGRTPALKNFSYIGVNEGWSGDLYVRKATV